MSSQVAFLTGPVHTYSPSTSHYSYSESDYSATLVGSMPSAETSTEEFAEDVELVRIFLLYYFPVYLPVKSSFILKIEQHIL